MASVISAKQTWDLSEDASYLDDEDQECNYEQEQEFELRVFAGRFQNDVKVLAKQYIESFFKNKMMHCGGRIPHSMLFSEKRVSLVLNSAICDSVDRAYYFLDKKRVSESKQIRFVNETLNYIAKCGVPQQFGGGVLLLYMEFIEGIDVGLKS